jgi:hypothetical protein
MNEKPFSVFMCSRFLSRVDKMLQPPFPACCLVLSVHCKKTGGIGVLCLCRITDIIVVMFSFEVGHLL